MKESTRPIRVLLIDDDEDDYLLTRDLFAEIECQNYYLDWANSYQEGLIEIQGKAHDVILVDYRLGGDHTGLDLVARAVQNGCSAPIIMLTGDEDRDVDLQAMHSGACDYLIKRQVDSPALERAIRYALERGRISQELRESQQRFELAVRGTNDGVWDWNLKTRQIYFSPRWKMMLGYAEDELENRIEEWFERVHPNDVERVKAVVTAHLGGLTRRIQNEYRIRHRDGDYRWMLSRAVAVRDQNGRVIRIAGSQTDITDRKLAEGNAKHTLSDPLTGLPNRALFMDRLRCAVERAKRNLDRSFALLLIDIEEFQSMNGTFGHSACDDLIFQLSQKLHHCLRPGDTIARYGADEFVILLEDVIQNSAALRIANRIQKTINTTYELEGCIAVVTAAVGVRSSSGSPLHPDQLLQDVELALSRAKAAGRGHIVAFEEETNREIAFHQNVTHR